MPKVPIRYIPKTLSANDKKKQKEMLKKSRRLYKSKQYYTRKKVASFTSKQSNHVQHAKKIYNVESVVPTRKLATKTGCSLSALQRIVKKGEGAYYSSGSRPNQTAQSWGLARLASSITSGKSAVVDYDIIDKGCDHNKPAFIMANKAKTKFNNKQTRKVPLD